MNMRLISMALDELPDERALADPCLTTNQHYLPPDRIDPGQKISHQLEFNVPFQKHDRSLPRPPITAFMSGRVCPHRLPDMCGCYPSARLRNAAI